MVIDVCTENLPTYIEQLVLTDLDKQILRETRIGKESSEKHRVIEGGLDLNIIEGNFTQTLFYCAQVY